MKVCILSHCFYPSKKRGGPTVSVTNMVKTLADKFDLSVITIIYDKGTDKPYDNVSSGKNRLFDSDVYYLKDNNADAFYSCIDAVKPDVIYVSSLFSYEYSVAAFRYAKSHKDVRIIVAPRGELMPLALKRKKFIKLLFINGLKFLRLKNMEFHVTSDEEESALKKIFKNHQVWKIKNLPSKMSADNSGVTKTEGELSVAMIGRIHPIKNIDYAIKLMSSLKGCVTVDIYGPEEDKKYFDYCNKLVSDLPSGITVNFKGTIDHENVANELQKHHIFLSPTESENYGHSIIESLLCGVPAVISSNTPWRNLENSRAGYDINLDRQDLFISALQKFIDMDDVNYKMWKDGAREYINSGLQVEETIDKYTEMFMKK